MPEQNKKEPLITGREAVGALGSVATGAGIAAATNASDALVAVSGGAPLLSLTFMMLLTVAMNWKRGEADRWWRSIVEAWAKDKGITPEEVEGRIAARANEPHIRETVLRAVRALADSVDDAAIGPLGVLAGEYMREEKKPDAFFRGTARLLADLSASQIQDLRVLANWVLTETKREDHLTLTAHQWKKDGKDWIQIPWYIDLQRDEFLFSNDAKNPNYYATTEAISEPEPLFHLLRAHGLGKEGGGVSFSAGPGKVVLSREVLVQLRRVLGTSSD